MSTIGRAFVAVVPPTEVLDAIDGAAAPMRGHLAGARWTTRDQWHVTLQFLGNRVDLDAAADALGALDVTHGTAQLGSAGAFPSERRGRVLWLGLSDGASLLIQLAAAVGALLEPLGFEPETRPYHPHLTLARLKEPTDLREIVGRLPGGSIGPPWSVEEVVLFESRTRSTGAEHAAVARIPLADR